MVDESEFEKYVAAVARTGYVLEHEVATAFRYAGWTVISNKYYLDDVEEKAREIDLLIYRSTPGANVRVYTTIMVSCKKSDSRIWAFLTRRPDLSNPNYNWQPLHTWSNDKALAYQLNLADATGSYYKEAKAQGADQCMSSPERDVFAMQELERVTDKNPVSKPRNDSIIFDGIASLMKAQAYEVGALPSRRKEPAIYQFNLLSVVDADLLRLTYDTSSVGAENTDCEDYYARYIVKKAELAARVRIVNRSALARTISGYDRLHTFNSRYFESVRNQFYESVLNSPERLNVFLPEFRRGALWVINHVLRTKGLAEIGVNDLDLTWQASDNELQVEINTETRGVEALAQSAFVTDVISKLLARLLRFSGSWRFAEFIPF